MWEELLKVQITNNKQDIKTSNRKLPESDDEDCQMTLESNNCYIVL